MPYAPEMKGEGLFFPRLPPVKAAEEDNERSFKRADFDSDPRKYIEKARSKHAGKTFLVVTPEHPEGKRVTIEEPAQIEAE